MPVGTAVQVLRCAHIALGEPLSDAQLAAIEGRLGFAFAPDHAALLRACLPTGEGWPDWRNAADDSLRAWLDSPIRGVLFDVSTNGFWPASWGVRPQSPKEAMSIARSKVALWPQMVPLYAHRFIPAGPRGRRIFSIHQSDVICYGNDLVHYLRREFYGPQDAPIDADPDPIWPWSDLAQGAEDADL